MATAKVNGVRLFYELNGTGEVPLVLVHGSWDSHHDWDLVVPRLADSFRVLTYDRRGHSKSERPAGPGSVREDVADLAALIEHLELEPDLSHMLQTRTRMSKRSSLSRASTALIMQEAKHNSRDNFTAMMASKGHPDGSLTSARLVKSPRLQMGETCYRAFAAGKGSCCTAEAASTWNVH